MKVHFRDFVLDADERVLLKAGTELSLEPKVFECLALLVARAGKLTSMAQLRAHLWPDVNVGDGALRRVINEARKVLGDTGSRQAHIRTRKGLGYVFVSDAAVDAQLPAAAPARVPRTWPFVGRERELEQLRNWLEAPSAGGLCLLSGEAGAGKSSLLARLQAEAPTAQRSARWFTSICPAHLGLPMYWPFRQIAQQLMRVPKLRAQVLPLTRTGKSALCALPELSQSSAHGRDNPNPFELCEAFGALLAKLSEQQPLCLVIEDLHWADAGSISMLDAVTRAARSHPLQVLASYRPEAVAPGAALGQFIGRSCGREGVQSQHLAALDLDAICALLRSLQLPGWAGPAPQVLQRMTGGNALFLSELLRHALALHLPLDAALPPSVAHIVEQRVRVLPEPTRLLLGQAAVLGHDFSLAVLAELAPSPDLDSLLATLEPARRAGVLERDPEHADRWQFSHALVGDALVESLPLSTRSAYHCHAMRAWQTLHGPAAPSGVLAAHAFAAGERLASRERRSLCERAGREAFAAHAYDQALLQLGRALQLLEPEADLPLAAELTLLWARAHWHADAAEQQIEAAFVQAAECARRAGRPDLFAQAAIGYALGDESSVHLRSVALRPEALELLEEAWTRLVQATPGGCAALTGEIPYRLAAALCWMRCEAGPLPDFQRAARLALRLAPPAPDLFGRLWLLGLQGAADTSRANEVHASTTALLESAELTLVQRIDGWILTMGSRLSLGDLPGYERAVREVARCVELLPQPPRIGRQSARLSAYVAIPRCARATLAVMRGALQEAEQAFVCLGQDFARLGLATTPEQANHMYCMLLWLYGYQGRAAQLEPLLDRHLETNPDAHWFAALTKAQFALERGERELACERFRVLRESRFRPQLRGKPLLAKPETLVRAADVCMEVGEPEDAAILYEALLPRADQFTQDGALICLGSFARPLAELALVLGKPELAEQHFRAALAQNERLAHRPELLRTRLGWARALLTQGRNAQARDLIAAAAACARELGMGPALAQAELLGTRLATCAPA